MPAPSRPLFLVLLLTLVLGGCASTNQLSSGPDVRPTTVAGAPESAKAEKLWQVYERYAGVPYEYGGTSARGFDCSGFIRTAFDEGLGQQLPRTTSQMLRHGEVVATDDIRPGDLVFFRIRGKEQHAGIYMGDNRFMHSSTSVGVTLSDLDGYYWKDRYTQARRFE